MTSIHISIQTIDREENHQQSFNISSLLSNSIARISSEVLNIGRKHKPRRSQKGQRSRRPRKMGNEESTPIDDSVPSRTLSSRSIEALADYIKNGSAKRIVVMTGAGISTSAGIPDFRSPGTGLYANLARLNLPYAEAVFNISYFRENPEPFYTLAHELYPGKFRPTITHSFIYLLQKKGLLLKLFTQNIDCLERGAGVTDENIIEAHGSFARQSCIDCKLPYSADELKKHIDEKTIPRCHDCKGLVKPEIVFFGEALPPAFFQSRDLPAEADLAIVMGTSLTVQPFASLPMLVRESTPRVLINNDRAGDLGSRADDVLLLGDCDAGVRKLAAACGWLEELEELWEATAPKTADQIAKSDEPAKDKNEELQDEIDQLTKEVDETLNMAKWHEATVRQELAARAEPTPSTKTDEYAASLKTDSVTESAPELKEDSSQSKDDSVVLPQDSDKPKI